MIEFVQMMPGDEGLLFQLPSGFQPVSQGRQPGGVLTKTYRNPGDPQGSSQTSIEVAIVPAALLASAGVDNPARFLWMVANGMSREACATQHSISPLGPLEPEQKPEAGASKGSFKDFGVIVACGRTPAGRSEATLMQAFRNSGDLFSLTWKETGPPRSSAAAAIDVPLWQGRLRQLLPMHLCPGSPGQPGPSPACVLEVSQLKPPSRP